MENLTSEFVADPRLLSEEFVYSSPKSETGFGGALLVSPQCLVEKCRCSGRAIFAFDDLACF